MNGRVLRTDPKAGFTLVVGVGGIGTGTVLALQGDHTLGRNESRLGQMLDARDYCKLHIVEHYIAVLMGAGDAQGPFRVFAVGNVGSDQAGETLLREIAGVGIDTRYVRVEPERSTLFSVCFLYPDRSGGNITASNSAACALSKEHIRECCSELAAAGTRGVALCLPEVPMEARQEFLRIATECRSYRVASFLSGEMEMVRKLELLSQVDLLALNHEEAAAMDGDLFASSGRMRLLDACSQVAKAANPNMKILVSAGADGAYIFEKNAWSHHKAAPTEVISTAGAGDALLAGVLAGLAGGLPLISREHTASTDGYGISSAIDLGLALACFSVTSPHTIHPGVTLESLLIFAKQKGISVSVEAQDRHARNLAVSTPDVFRGK